MFFNLKELSLSLKSVKYICDDPYISPHFAFEFCCFAFQLIKYHGDRLIYMKMTASEFID